ncbi:MAG: type VI secretion system ATPase TssH [Planctomycetes bacterium]|nr:type VI secretion system ATPase TssH [Planctomycetota bacterium]
MASVDLKVLLARLDRFCTRSLEAAAGLCVSRAHYQVTVEHMLLQMLEDPGADLSQILRHFEIDASRVRKALQGIIEGFKTGNPGKPVFSPLLIDWFQEAWVLSSIDHHLAEVRSGVLLRALLANPARFTSEDYSELLGGVRPDELKTQYAAIVMKSTEGAARFERGAEERGGGAGAAAPAGEALKRFTVNFTARSREGAIDPVFGRDREIRQMIDILGRRRKNNPIIVGEAGVGKTAVVEGLALRVVEGDVPDVLRDVEILGLDMGLLQAGAGVRGEFENRLKQVIDEVKASPKPIILFIDEAHTLIGAGGAAGGSDAANLLKPALARGELRTIAATTWSEYKKYFEKDAALARRFQLVKLDEPGEDDVVTMLRGLRDRYESSHGVAIRDDALQAAARLGSRYISGRQHPDKGVDLVDTAAARVKIALTSKPDALQDVERRIQTLERELAGHKRDRSGGIEGRDPRIQELDQEIQKSKEEQKTLTERWQKEKEVVERILGIRRRLESPEKGEKGETKTRTKMDPEALRKDLDAALAELRDIQGKDPLIHADVNSEVIARVVSDWTGIPVGKMVRDEAASILRMEENLGKRIKGQDHVLEIVARAIRAAKAGLKHPRQPMGCFLFVGPSGVGKTECALGVAELLFGGDRSLTVINMSEFQEKHTVSRLIGSPPGYVGYGEGGVLTEAVRQRPYSCVLLDEVEKSHPEVMNLFYQVFDKGMLADGEGREVDFKDTVIFMTSNLASDLIMESCQQEKPDLEQLTGAIRPALSRHFKPALLARMTIVPFYPIGPEVMKEIVQLKVDQLAGRLLESHRMRLDSDPRLIESIVQRCTEVETGARNIDHILSSTLLPRISTEILRQMSEGPLPDRLKIGLDDKGEFTLEFMPAEKSEARSQKPE